MSFLKPDGDVEDGFADALEKLAKTWGARLSEVRIRVYARALSDMTMPQFLLACQRAVRECSYFPSVAELRRIIDVAAEDTGLLAWAALRRAASEVGGYASVEIADAAAAVALEAVWGSWGAFCAAEDGPALGAARQEFLAAYRAARLRVSPGPRYLAGRCEIGAYGGVYGPQSTVGVLGPAGEIGFRRGRALPPATDVKRLTGD